MKTAEDIVALYNIRMSLRGDYLGRMADISRQYDNEVTVPLPELDRNEKPAVANLLSQGIDQYALRVASVMPDVQFPALRGAISGSVSRFAVCRVSFLHRLLLISLYLLLLIFLLILRFLRLSLGFKL